MSEGNISPESGLTSSQQIERLTIPEPHTFKRGIRVIAQDYKRHFIEVERHAKSYGMSRIGNDPELRSRFYEQQGYINAYETVLQALGQSELLQQLQREIKQELR